MYRLRARFITNYVSAMVLVRSGNTQRQNSIRFASAQCSRRGMADALHFHFHFRSYTL